MLITVTLNGGDYWNDHISLYEYGFQQVESVSLPAPVLPALPVAGGESGRVGLTASEPPAVVLLRIRRNRYPAVCLRPLFWWRRWRRVPSGGGAVLLQGRGDRAGTADGMRKRGGPSGSRIQRAFYPFIDRDAEGVGRTELIRTRMYRNKDGSL